MRRPANPFVICCWRLDIFQVNIEGKASEKFGFSYIILQFLNSYFVFIFVYSCSESESKVSKHLDALLTSSDCVGLYMKVLELVKTDIETQEYRGLTCKVGQCI